MVVIMNDVKSLLFLFLLLFFHGRNDMEEIRKTCWVCWQLMFVISAL